MYLFNAKLTNKKPWWITLFHGQYAYFKGGLPQSQTIFLIRFRTFITELADNILIFKSEQTRLDYETRREDPRLLSDFQISKLKISDFQNQQTQNQTQKRLTLSGVLFHIVTECPEFSKFFKIPQPIFPKPRNPNFNFDGDIFFSFNVSETLVTSMGCSSWK